MTFPSSLRPKIQKENIEISKKNLPSTLQPKQKIEEKFVSEEQVQKDIERNIARGTSRIGETLIGLPGDIYSFGKSLLDFDAETYLPTQKSLQELSEKTTHGYTKPKNEFEEKTDEYLKDVASMALPGAKNYGILRNFGIPLAGSLAKEGLKDMDLGDPAKAVVMIGLDLVSQRRGMGGGAKKYAGSLFEKQKQMIPEGKKFDTKNMQQSLNKVEEILKEGGERGSTAESLKKIGEIKNEISTGEADLKKIMAYRPSINELIDDLGGFDFKTSPKTRKAAIRNLQQVKNEVINAVNEGGKDIPGFTKLGQQANEAYSVYEKSNKISNFLQKHLGNIVKHSAAKSILGLGTAGGALLSPAVLTGTKAAVTLAAPYYGFKILYRVLNSPTLAQYYGNILKGAASGNVGQVTRNAKSLDKALNQEENK